MKPIRDDIWQSMLTAEYSVKYWEELSHRYASRLRWTGIVLAVSSSTAFLALLPSNQITILPRVIAFVSAALAIISTQLKWKELLAETERARGACIELASAYNQLWRSLDGEKISDATAQTRFDQIKEKEVPILINKPKIKDDPKLQQKCYKQILALRGLAKKSDEKN
jgi:hypothetical protein